MTSPTRQAIEAHDLVARYLADQLSESERESFEAYIVEHPEALRELDRTAQFKSGLIDLQRSGALEKLLKRQPWWQRPSTFALAAAIAVLVIGAGILWYARNEPRSILAASASALSGRFQATLPILTSYHIERTRSSSYDASIQIPEQAAAIELRIKPETVAHPARYRVTLSAVTDRSTGKQFTLNGLAPNSDGFVPVYLNASILSPAVYELKIAGETDTSGANNASSFLIELTKSSD